MTVALDRAEAYGGCHDVPLLTLFGPIWLDRTPPLLRSEGSKVPLKRPRTADERRIWLLATRCPARLMGTTVLIAD